MARQCTQTVCCHSHQSVEGLLLIALVRYVAYIAVEVGGSLTMGSRVGQCNDVYMQREL